MTQLLGWTSNILFFYGVWVIWDKNVKGFYYNAIANLLYMWQSVYTQNGSLFWLSLVLIAVNFKGIYQWQFKKNKKSDRKKLNDYAYHEYVKEVLNQNDDQKYTT